jgi:LEA14-like dessication related protein
VFKGFRTTVAPLEIRALSVGGADLSFKAEFRNESSFPLEIESVRYRLDLGGVRVADGTAAGGRLGPAASVSLDLPLLLEFFEMGADLYPLLKRQEAEFKLAGELHLVAGWGSQSVPFLETGRVAVRRAE